MISEKLIHLMGGQISVTSAPEKGSVFAFTIRARKPLRPAVAEEWIQAG